MSAILTLDLGDESPLLDERGCLTDHAVTMAGHLHEEQQAAIDRHARTCLPCAQRQTQLRSLMGRIERAAQKADRLTQICQW